MPQIHALSKVLVIQPDGRVLILRRSATDERRPLQGDLPGGWVDPGEDFTAAAIRETKEEAGIELAFNELQLVYGASAYVKEEDKNVTWLFFIGKTSQTDVTLSPEHDQANWMTLDQAIETIKYEVQNNFLTYARDHGLI